MSRVLDLFDFLNCCSRIRGGNDSTRSSTSGDSPLPQMPAGHVVDTVISETISNTEKEGHLVRFGFGIPRATKYFVLKNDLFWFERKDDLIPKGVVLLHSFRMTPQVLENTTLAEKNCLEIHYQSSSLFKAETIGESQEWRNALQKASSQVQEGVSYEGFLENFGLTCEWKKLWFVIRGNTLEYFDSPKSPSPSGSIDLMAAAMGAEASVSKFMAERNMFQLFYCVSETMCADNREDQQDWISAIREAIDRQQNDKMWLRKNPVGWKRAGKVREVVSPMLDLLRDPYRLEYFRWFIRELYCEHYLLFWLDVQQFRRLCKKEDKYYLKPCALVIYQKYIKVDSALEVDMPEESRERTLLMLDDPTVNTFRDAQMVVLQFLREFYPQFLVSRYAKEMAEKMFDV